MGFNQKSKESSLVGRLHQRLDLGESTAIALAFENPQSLLIIDEKKGRGVAKEMHLNFIGTLKVLLLAKQRGYIQSVLHLVEDLNTAGFRFSKKIVETILVQAGEI